MDKSLFIQQIDEYIKETYEQFVSYQEIAYSILVEFDRVSQKCGINYYIAYGSLLGAIRDGGQIPWDYDIDVVIKVEDRLRLLQALKENLSADFYYDYYDINPTYPVYCIRVCKKGYSMMALHVDVFFLIGVPHEIKKRDRFISLMHRCMKCRLGKYLNDYLDNEDLDKGILYIHRIKRFLYNFISVGLLNKIENILLYKYPLASSEETIVYGLSKVLYPRGIFEAVSQIQIGEKKFSIPTRYDEFLDRTYGDWHSYLPIKKRFEEFYAMKKIVDERQAMYAKSIREHNKQ